MIILRCWCSNPTGGKLFAINLLFTTKQYKVDNIVNFVYYGKTRVLTTGAGCKWWDDAVSRDVLYLSRTPHMLLYQGGKSLSHHQHLACTLYVRKCTPLPADADILTFTCLKSFYVNYIQIHAW